MLVFEHFSHICLAFLPCVVAVNIVVVVKIIKPNRQAIGAAALGLFAALATNAMAQAYPVKPVRVIVPFVAGGAADITRVDASESAAAPAPVIT